MTEPVAGAAPAGAVDWRVRILLPVGIFLVGLLAKIPDFRFQKPTYFTCVPAAISAMAASFGRCGSHDGSAFGPGAATPAARYHGTT